MNRNIEKLYTRKLFINNILIYKNYKELKNNKLMGW